MNYIKENQNAYKNENEFRFLKQKIKSVMENDEDELDNDCVFKFGGGCSFRLVISYVLR